jgi:hypothetical protein
MPHKGFYTQGLAILLHNAESLRAIEERLKEFEIVRRVEASASWPAGGPSLIVPYRPEANGYVVIDVVDRPWPDGMGDPKTEPEVFIAWGMGRFGPGVWPEALERACQHSWGWPEGHSVPRQHRAFIRICSSYSFGAKDDARVIPADYKPLQELEFATRIAAPLVRLPQTLCFFNPNGECVTEPRAFFESLNYHATVKLLPLDLWSNIRIFKFPNQQPVWSLMDTVGMGQLDVPDHEACFQSNAYVPAEIGNFLRNASAYVVERGRMISDGDTMNGPGNVNWQAFGIKEGYFAPPRPVLRWFPLDGRMALAEFTNPVRKGQ